MFPRFKALRSCDSDVLLPQQAHDDRLGHRCHEIPLSWTCHDLLWVAQCWLLPIDALRLTDFHKLHCFQCTGSCPVTLQVLCPKSSSLPAFGLRKQQQGELGHEWQAGAVWGGKGGWFLWRLNSHGFLTAVSPVRSSSTLLRRSTAEPARAEVWWCHPRLGIWWNQLHKWKMDFMVQNLEKKKHGK